MIQLFRGDNMKDKITCTECGSTMKLQKNICNELLYVCENCRHDIYLIDDNDFCMVDKEE